MYVGAPPTVVIQTSNGLAVGGMVLGIVAIVFAFIPLIGVFIAAPCALIALILGIVGAVRASTIQKGMGMAIVGIVLAVIAGIMMLLGGGLFW